MKSLFSIFRNNSAKSQPSGRRSANRCLRMESLEQRAMFSAAPVVTVPVGLSHTFKVTSAADTDQVGTLRWAIQQVNRDGNVLPDTIEFSIPPAFQLPGLPRVTPKINLLTELPAILRSVDIDGTTEIGGRVEINGADVTPPSRPIFPVLGLAGMIVEPYATTAEGQAAVDGLELLGGNSTVRGLVIDEFTGDGLVLAGKGGDVVQDDYLGTNAAGTAGPTVQLPGPNGTSDTFFIQQDGVLVYNVGNNLIGGTSAAGRNIISGDEYYGVEITGAAATGNVVEGNYVGTDYTGLHGISYSGGGTSAGVFVTGGASNNVVGGTIAAARNVLSYNVAGVSVGGTGNLVEGNYIGTDASGLRALGNDFGVGAGGANTVADNIISGNASDGLSLGSNVTVVGNWIGVDATGENVLQNGWSGIDVTGNGNLIGGTTAATRNVISGNHNANVLFDGTASSNVLEGNYIGTNAAGGLALANDFDVYIQGSATGNLIGGTAAGAGNVLAASHAGVTITDTATLNKVQGNSIGTNAAGTLNLGNAVGVMIYSNDNLVGGLAAAAGNKIAFNVTGVDVSAGTADAILSNSIYSNSTGIDLENGGNDNQSAPVLNNVRRNNNSVTVSGALHSTPHTKFVIQIFASPALDGSGLAEGELLLGSITVTTDGNGNASFNANFAVVIPAGQFITATATSLDAKGNPVDTSEFSQSLKTG
jgi:hypothetical protein